MGTATTEIVEEEIDVAPEDELRDSLASAFDEAEADANADNQDAAEAKAADPTIPADARVKNTAVVQTDEEKAAEVDAKAPASWSPAAREDWAKVPKQVQETIAKREREMSATMQETAQARQHQTAFNNMMQPFQPMFLAQGVKDPMQGVYEILQTSAKLQNGTPHAKAATMAGMIKQFGISIRDLDDAIVGNAPAAEAAADPRLDAMTKQINDMQGYFTRQNTDQQNTVNQETEKFLNENEFAKDLRTTMADFMDIAGRQNQRLTLQEAYDRAINTRPDIVEILKNRALVTNSNQRMTRARSAGVTVPLSTSGGNRALSPQSLRDSIADAFNNA